MRPNPSIERTRNGMPRLALTSFWAKRGLPERVGSNEGLGRARLGMEAMER